MSIKKNPKWHLASALILGLSYTGLGVARILAKRGIPVVGLDSKQEIGFFSKTLEKFQCPDPIQAEAEFVKFLTEFGAQQNSKPVIFPTSDEYVLAISRHRNELNDYYLFNLPDEAIIERLNNKYSFHELAQQYGIPVIPTLYIKPTELTSLDNTINFPIIIKSYYSYLSRPVFDKALIIENREQLFENMEWLRQVNFPLIIQKFLKGPQYSQYSYCGYFDKNSNPLAVFMTQKIRQNPIDTGVGTYVASAVEDNILEMGTDFLTRIKYSGMVEMEFIKDNTASSYWAVEVNTRPWGQIMLPWKCGIDFPYIQYADLVQKPAPPSNNHFKGICWMDVLSDLSLVFSQNSCCDRKHIGFFPWLKSLAKTRSFAVFSLNDPEPFLKIVRDTLKNKPKR